MGLAAIVSAAIVAPWLVYALSHVGIEPFLAASQTGTHGLPILQFLGPAFFSEPLFPMVAALGAVGLVWSIGTGFWLVPVWIAAIVILDPRKAETFAVAPVAILGATAMVHVLLPLLGGGTPGAPGPEPVFRVLGLQQRLGLYVVLGFVLLGGVLAPQFGRSPLRSLTPEVRDTLVRLDAETPASARFVVVTGDEQWAIDALSEWFPALAGRTSLGTVQGTEWLPGGEFTEHIEAYDDLQECADREAVCLSAWARRYSLPFDHVFIPRNVYKAYGRDDFDDCCALLRSSLDRSAEFELVFDSPGGKAYHLIQPAK